MGAAPPPSPGVKEVYKMTFCFSTSNTSCDIFYLSVQYGFSKMVPLAADF